MRLPETGGVIPQRRIGAILVSEGMVTGGQLEEALEVQKTDKRYVGKILVSLGYLGEEDLARALSKRLDVEYVDLSSTEVDPDVLGIISEDVLLQHKAVPLRVDNGRLIVAMSEPNNIYARSDLTISAGYPVAPVVAAEDAVARLQARLFGADLDPEKSAAAGRAGFASPEPGAQGNNTVDTPTDARIAERVEPGAQPEVDLGEPVVDSAAPASEVGAGREPKGRLVRGKIGAKGKIGDILIAEGKITGEQLEQALSMQRNDPRDIGKILVSLGYVLPADLARALARRLKLDYVVISDLSEGEVDPEALKLVGEETMRKYMALPLRFENGRLVVAMPTRTTSSR